MTSVSKDPWMRVDLIDLSPQQKIYFAMHQDYSSEYVYHQIERGEIPDDEECGKRIEKYLLKSDRGHYGPLEQMGITVGCGYMPHSLMQQLRTHRIAVTFDVMSFRYNSQVFLDLVKQGYDPDDYIIDLTGLEKTVYLRPLGFYTDRSGKKYEYTDEVRSSDLGQVSDLVFDYHDKVKRLGFSEEHARGLLPFDVRQHFVLSFNNIRSLWHMLDLRWKKDAQLEAQWFCDLLWEATKGVTPQLSEWYLNNRAKKARLAP
jgi:thymidylate synthase (FAD)